MSTPPLRRLPSGELVPAWRRRPPCPRWLNAWVAGGLLLGAALAVLVALGQRG